jgi:hypothetical protein
MDITNFTKQQGQFLKADDVDKSKSKIFVVTEEAQIVHNEKYDTDRLHISGNMDEKEFVFDCSKTNARIIEASLGKDTKSWIGKQILLETYKTKTTEGKMTSAVNVVKTL